MRLLTLLLASLAMLGLEACSNHGCTLVGCADGVTLRRNLTVTSPAVADLTLTVCLNGECGSGKIEASEGGGPLCKLSGRFVNNFCSLSRSPGAAEFLLFVEVSNRAPMDGDVYRFKLVRGDTAQWRST